MLRIRFSSMRLLAVTALAAVALATPACATVIWDTGTPSDIMDKRVDPAVQTTLGWSSGYVGADYPQRWVAAPFRIAEDTTINEIDAYLWAGTDATDPVNYIIWHRTNLDAPTAKASEGYLGTMAVADSETALCKYNGLNIELAAGDYYITIYGSDSTYVNWITGGTQQAEDLEWSAVKGHVGMWRSVTAQEGFLEYAPSVFEPMPGADPDDMYNPCFSLQTNAVPEPGSILVLGTGLLGLAASFRKKLF